MSHVRLAVVQLDYLAVARAEGGLWRLNEPLIPGSPIGSTGNSELLLGSLAARYRSDARVVDVCNRAMKACNDHYLANLGIKVRSILSFCFEHGVELIIFPEYSIPVEILPTLTEFSNHMTIVAGLGYLRRSDISRVRESGVTIGDVLASTNAAVFLSKDRSLLIGKKWPADQEACEPSAGPQVISVKFRISTVRIGAAICLDYLNEKSRFNSEADIVAVPALSANVAGFYDKPPRNYVTVFANHAALGGSFISVPQIKAPAHVDKNGTEPLPAGIEGIVLIDWDVDQPFATKPSRTVFPDHRLFGRSALLYAGRDPGISGSMKRLKQLPSEESMGVDDLLYLSSEIRADVERAGARAKLLSDAIDVIDSQSEMLSDYELRSLSRHCVLPTDVLTIAEQRYKECVSVAEQFKRLLERVPQMVAEPYARYDGEARGLAQDVRSNLLQVQHHGSRNEINYSIDEMMV